MELLDGASGLLTFCVACVTAMAVWLAWDGWRYRALDGVPGPYLASVTRLWHARLIWNGRHSRALVRLHDRLGPFVRIAPDEVSAAHPDGLRALLLEPLRKVINGNPHWFRFPLSLLLEKKGGKGRRKRERWTLLRGN